VFLLSKQIFLVSIKSVRQSISIGLVSAISTKNVLFSSEKLHRWITIISIKNSTEEYFYKYNNISSLSPSVWDLQLQCILAYPNLSYLNTSIIWTPKLTVLLEHFVISVHFWASVIWTNSLVWTLLGTKVLGCTVPWIVNNRKHYLYYDNYIGITIIMLLRLFHSIQSRSFHIP